MKQSKYFHADGTETKQEEMSPFEAMRLGLFGESTGDIAKHSKMGKAAQGENAPKIDAPPPPEDETANRGGSAIKKKYEQATGEKF